MLQELQAAIKSGERATLVVPTASMAEHLQHEMARRGQPAAAAVILPLGDFVESLTPECREFSFALERLMVERAVARARVPEFTAVAAYPGFHARLLETMQEFWASGPARTPEGSPVARVMQEYERLLERAGAVHRAERLRRAARAVASQPQRGRVLFDGFFHFTEVEMEFVRAATGAEPTLRPEDPRPTPVEPIVARASSPEREVEYIAGRILSDRSQTKRSFREYGVILRSPETYGPIVEAVFERFGIPFRSRHPQPLAQHGSVRSLIGLLRAPGGELAAWSGERLAPQAWAKRVSDLAQRQVNTGVLSDHVSHAAVLELRTLAAALAGWSSAAEDAAIALDLDGVERVTLGDYLAELEAVLRLTALRAPDRRRNVVQVLSVYEARQWKLPVVFVCGLVERWFPRYHSQNLFFSDAQRRRLADRGWRLRTTDERNDEERFLFDLARTRATEQLYLTYPAHDEMGGETLESFFLEPWKDRVTDAETVRAREQAPEWHSAPPYLRDSDLQRAVAVKHERISPSGLENYIQCPFLFFAKRTLRLAEPPPDPELRLNDLVLGTIIHRTIARWMASFQQLTEGKLALQPRSSDIRTVFEAAFAEVCDEEGIRLNFRAEAAKMRLLADLERFVAEEQERGLPAGFTAGDPESRFEYVVAEDPPFRVVGRIDRYDVSRDGAAVVVDYKYSREERLKRLVQEHEKGFRLQAPLYLLGLEKQRGLRPAGMMFYGLRKEISRRGWLVTGAMPPDAGLIQKTPEEFRALLERAAARTVEIVSDIRRGGVAVAPRDRQVCRQFCAYRTACRVDP